MDDKLLALKILCIVTITTYLVALLSPGIDLLLLKYFKHMLRTTQLTKLHVNNSNTKVCYEMCCHARI